MPDFKTFPRDQWSDLKLSNHTRLQNIYGKPHSWYRRSLSLTRHGMENSHEIETENYIRAAAIFKPGVPLTPLTIDVPWTMKVASPDKDWIMLMASPRDSAAWLQRCYESGARVFWISDDATPVYEYRILKHEEDYPNPRNNQSKPTSIEFTHEAVQQDIRLGRETMTALAEKYGVSRNTIQKIKKEMGMIRPPNPKLDARWPACDEPAICASLRAGASRPAVAEHYGITLAHVMYLQRKYNIFHANPQFKARKVQ